MKHLLLLALTLSFSACTPTTNEVGGFRQDKLTAGERAVGTRCQLYLGKSEQPRYVQLSPVTESSPVTLREVSDTGTPIADFVELAGVRLEHLEFRTNDEDYLQSKSFFIEKKGARRTSYFALHDRIREETLILAQTIDPAATEGLKVESVARIENCEQAP